MHALLTDLLKKRHIAKLDDLSDEEKKIFDGWQNTLSKKAVTVDDIADFCLQNLAIIENQWKTFDNTKEKNERLIVAHTVYKSMLSLVEGKKQERESLEKYLKGLLTE